MVIVSLPVRVHVDVHIHDGERAIRSEERVSRHKLVKAYPKLPIDPLVLPRQAHAGFSSPTWICDFSSSDSNI